MIVKNLGKIPLWKKIALAAVPFGIVALGIVAYRFLVLTWVNGTPLSRLELYHRLENQYGKKVKEEMIAEVLLRSESAKRGVVVSDGEVDFRISQIEQAQGGEGNFREQLRLQNLSLDAVKRQVKYQLFIERLFGQEKETTVSAEAIEEFIDKNKDNLPKTKTSSEAAALRQNVENQLRRQKISQLFNEWLRQALQKINL